MWLWCGAPPFTLPVLSDVRSALASAGAVGPWSGGSPEPAPAEEVSSRQLLAVSVVVLAPLTQPRVETL